MKNWLARLPIKSKLTLIVMLTNIAGLILAGTIIVAYDGHRGRTEMLEDVSTIALLIADRSTAALAFDDPQLAEENLAALRVKPAVTEACIYNENGSTFARYPAGVIIKGIGASVTGVKNQGAAGAAVTFPMMFTGRRHEFKSDYLTLIEPIMLNSKRVGAVYIKASLAELLVRRQNTMIFIAALILLSSLVAFFLSLWLQRMISGPLAHLTGVARNIALEKDYSVRAVKRSEDETGILVTSFNEMLETIDASHKSNEQYRIRQAELINEQQLEIAERKLVELELRESEEKFQRAFMSSPEAIAIVTLADATYIDVNENFLKLSGFDREELIGKSSLEYTIARTKEDLDRFNDIIKRDGKVREFEAEYCSKTGETGYILISAETIKIGNQLCLLKQYKDITARIIAQKSLKESEDRYREIFEKVSAGIFQTSKEGKIIIANPAFARMLGYASPRELMDTVSDIASGVYLNSDTRSWLLEIISRHGFVTGFETSALKKNKEIINVSINKHVVRNDAGDILYYEGTMEDVTVQKRFSELKSAMNIAQLGYWEYDVTNRSFVFNDEFFSIFRTTAEKSGGCEMSAARYVERFCHPDDREAIKDEIARAIETKDPHYSSRLEQQIIYSDTGETGYINYLIFIAKDADGRTVKIYGAVQDITKTKKQIVELQAARETAERATRSKSEFLAKMSHEIRTPLGAVIGLNNLLDKTALDKKQKDYVTKIKNSAAYLLQVINDVLDFTKIESGKMELENIEFSFENILEDIGDFSSIKSMGKKIEIIIDKDPDVPRLLTGDPLRVKQVLLNLMNNAIKFTETGTVVLKVKSYKAREAKIEMDFSVSDTGIGMTEFQLENLFQAYAQADSTTTRKYGGTGLGLNICYKFIDMMGGRLSVKSEFGRGSTFYFTLPFDVPDNKPGVSAHKIPENIKDMRILVADDSALFRKVVEKYVSRLGLSCHQAESGVKAVEALKERDFDVLFIDCNLPEMNGFETIKKIQGNPVIAKKPKVVFVTTLSDDTALNEMESSGIKNVLFKPLNESVIFNTLVNLFSGEDRDMVRKKSGLNFYPQNFDLIRGAKILVAEDNDINQQIIREILENQGFEVLIAPDGKRCVEMYQSEKDIDLILMDVQMPEMDGIEATGFIRGDLKDENIKIVALTADVIHETRERISTSGMNDFVSKPIDEAELFRALVRWIDPAGVKNPGGKPPERTAAETQPAGPGDTPEISFSEGIRRVTGNEKLYRELLAKFIAGNKELKARLDEYIRNKEYSSFAKHIHNFKGVASNLGLKAAVVMAAEIEAAAESEARFMELPGLALNLDDCLKSAVEDIKRYLENFCNGEEDFRNGEMKFLAELKRMLAGGEMAARDFFADEKDKFGVDEKDEYKGLSDAMNIYDFEAAGRELNLIIESREGKSNG
jgi:PAS domain S-box-containing protein